MPRPKSEKTKRDRSRQPLDLAPVFGTRADLSRVTRLSDGTIRTMEARGIGPKPIRVEGTRIVLHDINEWIAYLRRCA
mgnify:CR=1 FL=1